MVGAELQLEAVGSAPERRRHDPRVVDEDVDAVVVRQHLLGERAHGGQGGKVEVTRLHRRAGSAQLGGRGLRFGARAVPEHDRGAGRRERSCRFEADAAGRAGDHRDPAGEVDAVDDFGGGGGLIERHVVSLDRISG